tara:strand:+ start:289 stop:2967 length:2679 start_codon:yes stop_codon:yes gene_type:complete
MATNVDKKLIPSELDVEGNTDIEVALPGDDFDMEIVEEVEADGSVIVDFDPEATLAETEDGHGENIADLLDDEVLNTIGSELVSDYKDDRNTRAPWEKAYTKGVSLLGLNIEDRSQPWAGASGVFHPILTEAVVKFQAEAMTETFPAAGPVLTRTIGKADPELDKRAMRVQRDMNYQCTEVMTEYRNEHEQALFHLAIGGSIFKKVYFDHALNRYTSKFVMADDFVVSYGTTDLVSCPRATHIMKMWPNDLLKNQYSGFYRTVDVPKPSVEYTDVDRSEDKASGTAPSAEKDDRHELLEMHVDYDIPGYEDLDEDGEPTGIALPYVITIEKTSNIILSIYRNWNEDDVDKAKNEFFVHYPYLPGLGFYGIGLVHLLGGIAKSATSILRQLVDAGTLANLPAGLKSRGLRIKGDNSPLRPGEFRDVDIPGGSIKDNITFVPYKEPSTVLYQLLGNVVEEGRNIASIADLKVSDMSNQAPVGTTLAILERGMKVMSGVHARIHAAMRQEFKLLANLIREYAPEEYEYEVVEGATRIQDYDDRVDIFPVSNPNAATMAHRIMRHQAIQQLAQTAPQIYDLKELHRGMLSAMGEENIDKLIPREDEMKPMDPVAENMAIITAEPVKAHLYQDHESHIRVHMSALQDPKIQEVMKDAPNAQAIAAAGAAHIQEHVAFQYRREIEKQLGVPMPEFDKDLPAETEVQLSKLTADAAEKLLKKDVAEMQAAKNAEQQNDPVLQLQKMDAETKQAEVQRKGMADKLRSMLGKEQISSKEKMEGARLGVDVQSELVDKQIELKKLELEQARMASLEKQAGAKLGVAMSTSLADDQIERERIAAQTEQAVLREETNVKRNEDDFHVNEERLANERMRDTQNFASRFIDIFRSNPKDAQKSDEN